MAEEEKKEEVIIPSEEEDGIKGSKKDKKDEIKDSELPKDQTVEEDKPVQEETPTPLSWYDVPTDAPVADEPPPVLLDTPTEDSPEDSSEDVLINPFAQEPGDIESLVLPSDTQEPGNFEDIISSTPTQEHGDFSALQFPGDIGFDQPDDPPGEIINPFAQEPSEEPLFAPGDTDEILFDPSIPKEEPKEEFEEGTIIPEPPPAKGIVVDEPVFDEPVDEEPIFAADEPIDEEPIFAADEPIDDDPIEEEPVLDPMVHQPIGSDTGSSQRRRTKRGSSRRDEIRERNRERGRRIGRNIVERGTQAWNLMTPDIRGDAAKIKRATTDYADIGVGSVEGILWGLDDELNVSDTVSSGVEKARDLSGKAKVKARETAGKASVKDRETAGKARKTAGAMFGNVRSELDTMFPPSQEPRYLDEDDIVMGVMHNIAQDVEIKVSPNDDYKNNIRQEIVDKRHSEGRDTKISDKDFEYLIPHDVDIELDPNGLYYNEGIINTENDTIIPMSMEVVFQGHVANIDFENQEMEITELDVDPYTRQKVPFVSKLEYTIANRDDDVVLNMDIPGEDDWDEFPHLIEDTETGMWKMKLPVLPTDNQSPNLPTQFRLAHPSEVDGFSEMKKDEIFANFDTFGSDDTVDNERRQQEDMLKREIDREMGSGSFRNRRGRL